MPRWLEPASPLTIHWWTSPALELDTVSTPSVVSSTELRDRRAGEGGTRPWPGKDAEEEPKARRETDRDFIRTYIRRDEMKETASLSEWEAANISLTTPWITNPPLSFSSTSEPNSSERLSIDCLDTVMYYSSDFSGGIPPLLACLSSQWKVCCGSLSGWGTVNQTGWEAVKRQTTHRVPHPSWKWKVSIWR